MLWIERIAAGVAVVAMGWLAAACAGQTTQPATVAGRNPASASAAASAATPAVHLLAMGDWGTNGPGQRRIAAALASFVGHDSARFSAMLLVGDNFYMKLPGGVNDPVWQSAFEQMYDPRALNFPFYAVLGNHDYRDGKTYNGKDMVELNYAKLHPQSRWKLPARWYRVDFPADHPLVTALMLDSNRDSELALGPAQWEAEKTWLAGELAKPRGTWTICCAHHPLFSNGGHGDNPVLQNDWGKLFVQYNVDFYICGHDHDLQQLQIPRWFTSFVIVGGGGAETTPMRHDDRGPMSRRTTGFGVFDFSPSSVTVRYVTADGQTIHEFQRSKDGQVRVLVEGGHTQAVGNPLEALEGFGGYTPPASQPAGR
jgi:tartrate-resistant acid phosphatase type 5